MLIFFYFTNQLRHTLMYFIYMRYSVYSEGQKAVIDKIQYNIVSFNDSLDITI